MFHFFRIIRQKLLFGEKFRKYIFYAFGEIILIAFGILLANQVREWNLEKKNRMEENILLSRLNEELNYNTNRISGYLQGIEGKERALNYLASAFKSGLVENDSVFFISCGNFFIMGMDSTASSATRIR